MAAKEIKSPSIAQIEKRIARVAAELQRARKQQVTDAKKSLAQVKVAVTAAATQVKQLTAAGATTAAAKKKLQKARSIFCPFQLNFYNNETSKFLLSP